MLKEPEGKLSTSRTMTVIGTIIAFAIIVGMAVTQVITAPEPVFVEAVVQNGQLVVQPQWVEPTSKVKDIGDAIQNILWGMAGFLLALYGTNKIANGVRDGLAKRAEQSVQK